MSVLGKIITANIVAIFWAIVYGEIIGYIGSALEVMPYNPGVIGLTAAIVALIGVNGAYFLSRTSKKTE